MTDPQRPPLPDTVERIIAEVTAETQTEEFLESWADFIADLAFKGKAEFRGMRYELNQHTEGLKADE